MNNAPDTLPLPKNGQWLLLDFEVHGLAGDLTGLDLLARNDIFSAAQDGPTRDIGDSPTASCVAGISNDGVTSINARQIMHITVLADVPSPHGYVGYKSF